MQWDPVLKNLSLDQYPGISQGVQELARTPKLSDKNKGLLRSLNYIVLLIKWRLIIAMSLVYDMGWEKIGL